MNDEKLYFEWYVINSDINSKDPKMYNIFNNWYVNEECKKFVKRYLRAPSKYESYYLKWGFFPDLHKGIEPGFKSLVHDIDRTIMSEEWSRCEYEIIVGDLFADEEQFVKMDCYDQCKPNMEAIAREIIFQYKKFIKGNL